MTAVALSAVLPQVPIVFLVAGNTLLRHLHRARWITMAAGALQFAVRAQEGEMRVLGVIENP
jgi:hypothetical protein